MISLFYFFLTESIEEQIGIHALSIASLTSSRVDVRKAYSSKTAIEDLRGIAEEVKRKTNAVFVVFLNMEGVRYTHPNPELIGKHFTGNDEGPALLEGKTYRSKAIGISGPSIRAFAPIYDFVGNQVGAVAVGFFQPDIAKIISGVFKILYLVIPVGIFSIALFSFLLSRNIKKTIFGMEPIEIATQLKERETMFQSVREGIIAINNDCQITVINNAAKRLLNQDHDFLGQDIREVIPNTRLPLILESGQAELDEPMLLNGHLIIANRIPLTIGNKLVGAISTFRDMTEMNYLAEELTGARRIVDSLRARTHEFMNKLHVISGLIQLGSFSEAQKYITRLTAKEQSFIEFLVQNIKSPATAGLLEGKATEAEERNISLDIDPESKISFLPSFFDENAMVVVLGNLIDNAMDAVKDCSFGRRKVFVSLKQDIKNLTIKVSDTGTGIPEEIHNDIFKRGFTTKELGMGFGLANLKSRVDLAQGEIKLNTNKNGTTFTITIPNRLVR